MQSAPFGDARRLSGPGSVSFLDRIFSGHHAIPFAVRLWDGTTRRYGAHGVPQFTLALNHPGAVRRMFFPPNELSLGEAYIYGDYDIEGSTIAYNVFRFATTIREGRRMKFSALTREDLYDAFEQRSDTMDEATSERTIGGTSCWASTSGSSRKSATPDSRFSRRLGQRSDRHSVRPPGGPA